MSKKVLIVEDDKNFAETLKNIFVEKDLDVKVSASTHQAEQMMSFECYDLLVVDIVLPNVNGIVFLREVISKGLLTNCQIWVISGVLNKKVISADVLCHIDEFLKKPLSKELIEKRISTLFAPQKQIVENINFFYLDTSDNKKNILENKQYVINGHELMFIVFYLYSIQFSGMLHIANQKLKTTNEILFVDGCITAITHPDKHSYLGVLLVKNNLISKEDMKKILVEKKDVPLGDYLVSECYISPHQLHKILREQLAIRLFTIMELPSVTVHSVNFIPSQAFSQVTKLEEHHIFNLVDNWMNSLVNMDWLKEFFKKNWDMYIHPASSSGSRVKRLKESSFKFVKLDGLREPRRLGDIFENTEATEKDIACEIYYRLVVGDHYLKSRSKVSVDSRGRYDFLQKKYKTFLESAKTKSYFELLSLPVNASQNKVDLVYKSMVKTFHPDRLNQSTPEELRKICNDCFLLITKIYQTLSNPEKKKEYMSSLQEKNDFHQMAIKNIYIKGKKNVEQSSFASALESFKEILNHKLAPNETFLYYIWAIIKNKDGKLTAEESKEIKMLFDKVSLKNRQSAIFYFVKGLFMKAKKEKEMAFSLFKKAVDLDNTLTVARVELYSLSQKKKKTWKSFFKKAN